MIDPPEINERPEQLRPPITKGSGTTKSERYLAQLAEKSFLNLWSYPSPYRNQKQKNAGDGKELCDLLVVCGKHVIIFSEKSIAWPSVELDIAWRRWTRSAIRKAAKQANGAQRWITDFPKQIFLDRKCWNAFPLDFPNHDERIIHKIVVARGASTGCRKHRPGNSGSLIIKPSIQGSDHWPNGADKPEPFAIGDIDPAGPFVHVFDEVALTAVMNELDTIRDFTEYLGKRSDFIRSGLLREVQGEENLLAHYLTNINDSGDHDFVVDPKLVPISIDSSSYLKLKANPQYLAKKHADEISYLWDRLIEQFTAHMLGGTSIAIDELEFDIRKNEIGVRYMALQRRFARRNHGEAFRGAMEIGATKDRFFRLVLGHADSKENDTAFFILTFKFVAWMASKGGYEQYRRKRTELAIIYAQAILMKYPYLERVVGVSLEPPGQEHGSSEDLVYVEQDDWTADNRKIIDDNCKLLRIFQGSFKVTPWSSQEYPEVRQFILRAAQLAQTQAQNRKQRRAESVMARTKK